MFLAMTPVDLVKGLPANSADRMRPNCVECLQGLPNGAVVHVLIRLRPSDSMQGERDIGVYRSSQCTVFEKKTVDASTCSCLCVWCEKGP